MAYTITDKQREVFDFLKSYIEENGRSPSYEEIKEETGLSHKSAVHNIIKSLERRGWIKTLPHKSRAIEIIHESAEDNIQKIRQLLDNLDVRVKKTPYMKSEYCAQFADDVRDIVK